METIIHIGQHKTATTSIQHFLQNNKRKLLREKTYVPESLLGHNNPSHYLLNVYSLSPNRYSSMKQKLELEGFNFNHENTLLLTSDIANHYKIAREKKCDKVIWSNEGLYLLNSISEYKTLYQLFSSYSDKVTCICCFRDKTSFMKSYSSQLSKQNIQESHNDKSSYTYLAPDSWLFDYERKIHLLSEVFDNVITFQYDPTDNISSFLEKIKSNIKVEDEYRMNVTSHLN